MSNKILVKADPTLYQMPGKTPSIMDLGRAVRGRGTTPGSKVGVGGRLAAGLGLAGKGAAALATAQQTAERMQGGDFTAPLQAGYAYQANDPTGQMTADAIQGTVPQRPAPTPQLPDTSHIPPGQRDNTGMMTGAVAQPSNVPPGSRDAAGNLVGVTPAPAQQLPTSTSPQAPAPNVTQNTQFTGVPISNEQQQQVQQRVNNLGIGPNALAQQAPAIPLDTTAMMGVAQQQQPMPQQQMASQPFQVPLPGQTLSPTQQNTNNDQRVADMKARGVTGPPPAQQQQQQGHGTTYPPGYKPTPYKQIVTNDPMGHWGLDENWGNNKAFADTVFDKLGPDMVYKMTPHQIATLSAYMYLKLS